MFNKTDFVFMGYLLVVKNLLREYGKCYEFREHRRVRIRMVGARGNGRNARRINDCLP